jgi:PadR family transcriptional regulator PadR
MLFTVNSSLLDAIVLSVVAEEDTYGYKITQEVNNIIGISESTLYPVLRRLQKDNNLEVYDMEYLGRNRRYYKITHKGKILLSLYKEEWEMYKAKIDKVFEEKSPQSRQNDSESKGKPKNIGEFIDNLKINEKIENLKIPEKIENLKLDDKIEKLKSEGIKLGKKFDKFISQTQEKVKKSAGKSSSININIDIDASEETEKNEKTEKGEENGGSNAKNNEDSGSQE